MTPGFHYIGREPSLSMVQNAKSGMKLAKGKYIANIHDDDVLDTRFLEMLIHPMEQDEKIGLVFCDHKIIDAAGIEVVNTKESSRAGLAQGILTHRADALFDMVIPTPSGRLFKSGSIDLDEIYDGVGTAYDWWMSFLHCKSTFECYYVPEKLMSYRVHLNSMTSAKTSEHAENVTFILSHFLIYQSFPDKNKIIKKRMVMAAFNIAKCRLLLCENAEARAGLIKAFRLTGSLRCIMAYLFACLPSGLTHLTLKAIVHFRK